MKTRVDTALTQRGLAPSRERAQALIMAGQVYIGEKKVLKASEQVEESDELIIRGEVDALASRGGHKIERALEVFHADVKDIVAMDIGAAAGGFTDVLLRHGAKHVYAIDVGYGQLDWKLRQDERVIVMERTNARHLTPDMVPLGPTLTVMDVSFISIRLILPVAAAIMGEKGRFLTLVKPQFEAGRGQVGKNGVVRDEKVHRQVLMAVREYAEEIGWHVAGFTWSPIKGPKGNIEFLADIRPGAGEMPSDAQIIALVEEAHRTLD
ncbi:MAG: TlyA family RNA methyltransferase [Clostridia bacterium]|nr:TlyA family RNA methyltransferase [Clostridia bacterium]